MSDRKKKSLADISDMNELLTNIEKLQTPPLGQVRICRNLGWNVSDVVPVCRNMILSPVADITRRGKNWYIASDDCMITVNATTFTIITAHRFV